MSAAGLSVEIDGRGVATVRLDRPERRNAFDDFLIAALTKELTRLGKDQTVRAVVLTGAGETFSAGADINWMRRMASYTKRQNIADAMGLARLLRLLNELPQPTIARVNGAAYAGALGLIVCCDIAVAAEEAVFAISEVRVGLWPATIAPYLTAAVGTRAARRYCLTGESFSSATALRLGLVHEIAPREQLDAAVEQIIGDLLKGGPQAQIRAKRMVADVAGSKMTPALMARTAAAIADARASAEGREGLAAFLEKRKPAFRR